MKAFFLEVRVQVHPSEVALSSRVGMWGCAEDFPPWRPNLKVKVELRKTKGVHCWPSRCYPSNCKRCSFSCLSFHSLVALERLKLSFNIGRGRILILTRKLTNPHGSLFLGYWPLWWFPGSSASSYRGISGSDWRCTQLGCSTGRWTHRGRG